MFQLPLCLSPAGKQKERPPARGRRPIFLLQPQPV